MENGTTGFILDIHMETAHHFTPLEIKQAAHEFRLMIIKHFGKVWSPPSDAMYDGCEWVCRSMIILDNGLWHLVQRAIHKNALRAFGKLEVIDSGYALRFLLFYKISDDKGKHIYERG